MASGHGLPETRRIYHALFGEMRLLAAEGLLSLAVWLMPRQTEERAVLARFISTVYLPLMRLSERRLRAVTEHKA